MNPVPAAVTIGLLTVLGRWARGKTLTIDTVVGVVVLAVLLAMLDQVNNKLARAFGALAVVAVAIVHLPAILDKAGVQTSAPVKGLGNRSGGGGLKHGR